MTVCVSIEPLDTLFFRDALPFTAGEDNTADSLLPSPLSVYGAIGSYYLESNNLSLSDFLSNKLPGTPLGRYAPGLKDTGFSTKGPFLALARQPYFAPPANVWVDVNDASFCCPGESSPEEQSDLYEQFGVSHISLEVPEKAKPLTGLLSTEDMKIYLSGDNWVLEDSKPESEFVARETRHGHQLNRSSRTVQEHMLYSSSHLRFYDSVRGHYEHGSLLVSVDTLNPADFSSKASHIGGERRLARFVALDSDPFAKLRRVEEVLEKVKDSQRKNFFLYLATPAIFNDGWRPPEIDGARLIGAAINKPLYVSGWQRDGQRMGGKPRAIERAVPAGSVYFFEAPSWNEQRFEDFYADHNFGRSISDKYPDAGFGIVLIGTWTPRKKGGHDGRT